MCGSHAGASQIHWKQRRLVYVGGRSSTKQRAGHPQFSVTCSAAPLRLESGETIIDCSSEFSVSSCEQGFINATTI
jgi:hypothetical protein